MAIAIFNRDKYERAKEIAGDDQEKLIEEYKKMTPNGWVEGTNEEIESTPKHIGIFDEEKPKRAKRAKKSSKKKK